MTTRTYSTCNSNANTIAAQALIVKISIRDVNEGGGGNQTKKSASHSQRTKTHELRCLKEPDAEMQNLEITLTGEGAINDAAERTA